MEPLLCNNQQYNGFYKTANRKDLQLQTVWYLQYQIVKSGENSFIKDMIGANSESWIGVYDPNKSTNYCFDTTCTTKYDRQISNGFKYYIILFKLDSIDISNLVYSQDSSNIGTSDGTKSINRKSRQKYYVLMSGTTGKWRDYGPHYNNPSPKFSAGY